jgi:parvulin-like peptidyl-prolyl isomerase
MCYNTKMAVKKKTIKKVIPAAEKAPVLQEEEITPVQNKMKQPKVLIGLTVVLLLVLGFMFKGLFVAAMVNGEPISRLSVISELEKQGGKQTLTSLINQALILQEAKKKNIQISKSDIDASLKQIEDSLKGQGQDLDTALSAQGMTRQDLEGQLKLRLLVEKILADKTKVSDKEIADYIEKNKDTFPTTMKEEEIRKSVAEQLKQQKLASESQTWLQELNKNAKIDHFVNY